MDYKIKEGDTETWILLFLYKVTPQSINDMATNGCKKMVFGAGLPKFQQILDKMVQEKLISLSSQRLYALEIAGLFKLKQTVYVPLLTLNSNDFDTVLDELRSSCDVSILEDIRDVEDEQAELVIKEKGKQCLDVILYIAMKIPEILDDVF